MLKTFLDVLAFIIVIFSFGCITIGLVYGTYLVLGIKGIYVVCGVSLWIWALFRVFVYMD